MGWGGRRFMQMIIPALNEESRLPDTLRALRAYALGCH